MNDKKTFGEFITQKRKEAGLTQKSFAEKIFVTESAVSKWERGISFPDITLIRDICETLGINEHELLTSSEDLESRNTERIAKKYIKMIERYKLTLFFLYGISLLVCFICNLVITNTLSWFFIVLTSQLVAFSLTLLPVLLKSNRGVITLASFFGTMSLLLLTCNMYSHGDWFWVAFASMLFGMTIVFLPFVLARIGLIEFVSNNKALICFIVDTILLFLMLLVCDLYTDGGWFLTRAVPISLFSLIVPWSIMLIIRYTRINGFLKTSACISILAAFMFFANGILNTILGEGTNAIGFRFDFRVWNDEYISENINMTIFLWLILMSVIFAIAGIRKREIIIKKSITFLSVLILAVAIALGNKTSVYAANEDSVYNEIDEFLEKEVKEAHIPGMSVVIVDKNEVLFSNTYGNCENIDAPFIIGSNSKSFTATAIMQLVEENKIDLDESIAKYLPSATEGDKITIRQLLNHTSGISTYDTPEHYKVSSNQGTYSYANANYGLLGQIIETVSGMTYDNYVKTYIFEPLNMNHSFTSLKEAKKNGLIAGYRNYLGFMIPEQLPYPDVESRGWLSIPAGYIISSASDMGKYLQFYLNDGNGVLQPESIQTMFYDSVKVSEDRTYGFGWGVMNNYPETVISHGGLVENYSAQMFILPESEIAGVILINDNDYLVANEMTGTILYGVFAKLFGEEPTYINESSYVMTHLFLDVMYLAIAILCVLPLLLFGKWKKQLHNRKKAKAIIGFTLLHIILPTVLLLVPKILGTPMSVIRAFVPDFYIVIVGGAIVAYGTGLCKIVYLFKNKN